MASVNIYKITNSNNDRLLRYLESQYDLVNDHAVQIIRSVNSESLPINFEMTLYLNDDDSTKPLSWNWALTAFEYKNISFSSKPKAVIVVDSEDTFYAITFGHSYFKVDQFSDKEWAFNFARRLDYTNVRTIAITNPNSQRNKTVNTYLDYENLDIGSGEAFTKIKAKIERPSNLTLYEETLEVGNSIKFDIGSPSLETIAQVIEHVNNTINYVQEKHKIPYFKEVKDDEEKERLFALTKAQLHDNLYAIDFSEYQIYATRIIFKDDHQYILKHNYRNMPIDSVNVEMVAQFMHKYNFNVEDDLFRIRVEVLEDGITKYCTPISNLIFYTIEEEHALLSDGKWYTYNEDYLSYLSDSISEIYVNHDLTYDYSRAAHEAYIEEKYNDEHLLEEYSSLSIEEIKERISRKYYRELYFNNILEDQHGYINFDRSLDSLDKHKLEVMDLYKENTMYTVKFGNSSSKLCYAVDQSLEAIKAYQRGEVISDIQINNVCLWLVLNRNPLPLIGDMPDLNQLKMLILKNKLDHWKKEVRLLGKHPIININYVNN